jgi:hypothetical protein
MMNKKFLFISFISIVQSNFCMDVVPEPELVRLEDGHEWTRITDPRQVNALVNDVVAWRSDDIPGKGLKLDGHPDHHYAKIIDYSDGLEPKLCRVWPHDPVILGEVPSLTVRLLTCAEARSWMRSANTQPSAGAWVALMQPPLREVRVNNLLPRERTEYFRSRIFKRSFPDSAGETSREAHCLLALQKFRKGSVVARYCSKDTVRLIARFIVGHYDDAVRVLRESGNADFQPNALLIFEQKKP